jgi:hypothetical protein
MIAQAFSLHLVVPSFFSLTVKHILITHAILHVSPAFNAVSCKYGLYDKIRDQ